MLISEKVGYQVKETSLEAKASILTLSMAFSGLCGQERDAALIHHSDIGRQYGDQAYAQLLN